MTVELEDVLEFDAEARTLIVTEQIAPGEYGASWIVARDVPYWFGVWAVTVWENGVIPVEEVSG